MERRYEAYKSHVVRPFFRDHFARLDRQIVLVDALQAINAGAGALCRSGRRPWPTSCAASGPAAIPGFPRILARRIDRILFAATKADHVHSADHGRLQDLLTGLVDDAVERARFSGATVDMVALASVRATREATVRHRGEDLPAILGTPIDGEVLDGTTYDGETEIAIFPGDLPEDPAALLATPDGAAADLRFLRFRPPLLERGAGGLTLSLPHIRLDRCLEFLIGDKLA